MKIWIKYFFGCVLGITMALLLAFDTENAKTLLQFFTDLSIRVGRYFLLPVLFFSMTVAVTKLRTTGKLFRTGFFVVIVGISATVIIMLFGLASVLIINLPRIPISAEKASGIVSLNIPERLLSLFPFNGIAGLLDGAYLFPLYILAGFAGAGFASDTAHAKPAYTLFDSLSKVCYSILSFFIDFLSIGIIAISCTWFISFFDVLSSGAYTGLIILLATDTLLIIGGLLPLLLRLICKETRPYKVLYAIITPILIAFFSGDANLTLSSNLRHAKDSLGIKRRIGAVSLPLFSTFVRSGSALVMVVSFIAVVRSYSSLGISFSDILWLSSASLVISFLLGALPTGGPFVALTLLCTMYGRGFEAGYLLLKPIAFIMCSFSTVIDATVSMFCTYLIAHKEKMIEPRNIRKFI